MKVHVFFCFKFVEKKLEPLLLELKKALKRNSAKTRSKFVRCIFNIVDLFRVFEDYIDFCAFTQNCIDTQESQILLSQLKHSVI